MQINNFINRIVGKYRRTLSALFYKRINTLRIKIPIVSFSFDDAPKSAFIQGGSILKANGVEGTFFVSLGLLESESPSGKIASLNDLQHAVAEGHELGCHTFDHRHSWDTLEREFEKSVLNNQRALDRLLPGISFKTFAYPICLPRPVNKRRVGRRFICCRGGGQTLNAGKVDLNMLKAYFFDRRFETNFEEVKRLIDLNAETCGWLIFATHDVADEPSQYGCSTEYFKNVVRYAVDSGALILTVEKGCQMIQK